MKRWLGLFVVLAVMAVVAALVFYRNAAPARERAAFDQIKPGMTRDYVVSVLGTSYEETDYGPDTAEKLYDVPAGTPPKSVRWIVFWDSKYDEFKYGVSFTPGGEVVETWIFE